MNFWEGVMNWPLEQDWECETCGVYAGLIWGLVHATCRCFNCHTHYRMRDKDGKIVKTPICQLKSEYKEPAKVVWQKLKKPIDQVPDKEWDECISFIEDTAREKIANV